MFCCGFLWLFLFVCFLMCCFTIVSKTYCTLNHYLFYLLLPVCHLCFCFLVSNVFIQKFEWILKEIAVFMVSLLDSLSLFTFFSFFIESVVPVQNQTFWNTSFSEVTKFGFNSCFQNRTLA